MTEIQPEVEAEAEVKEEVAAPPEAEADNVEVKNEEEVYEVQEKVLEVPEVEAEDSLPVVEDIPETTEVIEPPTPPEVKQEQPISEEEEEEEEENAEPIVVNYNNNNNNKVGLAWNGIRSCRIYYLGLEINAMVNGGEST